MEEPSKTVSLTLSSYCSYAHSVSLAEYTKHINAWAHQYEILMVITGMHD